MDVADNNDVCINLRETGEYANIQWRAVDMEHLRQHPLYRSLPLSAEVRLNNAQSLGLFRQGTWQWDALHSGRLTTSKLACCLGFYESSTASVLDIPKSLQSHSRAVSAWKQLCASPIKDYSTLLQSSDEIPLAGYLSSAWSAVSIDKGTTEKSIFPFIFTPVPSNIPMYDSLYSDPMSVRLAWGSAQEATAVLAALNYFHGINPGVVVHESGMYAIEALQESIPHRSYIEQQAILQQILHSIPTTSTTITAAATTGTTTATAGDITAYLYDTIYKWIHNEKSLPLLGASPDGTIEYPDGTIEVLEVKCVSPYITRKINTHTHTKNILGLMSGYGGRSHSSSSGSSSSSNFGVWHIPQLQWEMLCVGAHCRSAVIVILSIQGARLFRVQRDDQVRI